MSEERQDAPPGGTPVKVVDRRRFRPDGEPLLEPDQPPDQAASGAARAPAAPPDPGSGEGEPPVTSGDERDERIAAQEGRIDELMRAYAALVEDNKAFRVRQEREKARVIEAERAGIAQALLEAADDLERALAAVSSAEVQGRAMENMVEGVRLSLSGLHKRIAELGAERFGVLGQPFDPRVAEAVDTVPITDADQDGCVVQEIRPGYRIGERVLRPARVRVGRLARA
jgi:molecular chaperone GrpE